ncbi:hypothetical protein Tco_1252636 [Tanacetum coccineum]
MARGEEYKSQEEIPDSSQGRITPTLQYLVYNEDENNYNYYMMYKNQKYDLDNAMEMRNKVSMRGLRVASLVLERIANLVNEKATSSVNEEATSSVNEEVASLFDEEAASSVDEEAASLVDEEAVNPVRSIDSNDGRGRGGFVVLGGRSSRESKNACGEVGGVKNMSLTGSKFMVRGEECLEGCVGAGGGEVNKGGDDFGVSKSLLGEILRVVIGESGGEIFGDDGGAVW